MSGHFAVDGDFHENVGSTESSFDAFLAAIGESAAEDMSVPVEDLRDAPSTEYDLNEFLGETDEDEAEEEEGEEFETPDEESEEEDITESNDDAEAEEQTEEEEVDFGDLEIDMDSEIQIGDEFISINDLVKNRMQREELAVKLQETEELLDTLTERETTLSVSLEKAVLECDKVIDDYKTFDWKKLAVDDPASYAQHREFLEAYLARKDEIEKDYVKVKEKETREIAREKQQKVNDSVKVLKSEIPGWNDALYGQMMDYAINTLGMSEDFVTQTIEPGFFKTVHGLMKREKDLKTAVTKVRKPTVTKVAKSATAAKTGAKKAVTTASKKRSAPPSAGEAGISSYDTGSYKQFAALGIR